MTPADPREKRDSNGSQQSETLDCEDREFVDISRQAFFIFIQTAATAQFLRVIRGDTHTAMFQTAYSTSWMHTVIARLSVRQVVQFQVEYSANYF